MKPEVITGSYFRENDSPRSLALSEMGSEVDVDHSLNISSFISGSLKTGSDETGCKFISVANTIVNQSIIKARLQIENDDVISDSGTDSFSEQMVSSIHFRFVNFRFNLGGRLGCAGVFPCRPSNWTCSNRTISSPDSIDLFPVFSFSVLYNKPSRNQFVLNLILFIYFKVIQIFKFLQFWNSVK